jgi:hypothetical protein
MLFKKTTVVYSKDSTKLKNKLCGLTTDFLNVKSDGISNYRSILEC